MQQALKKAGMSGVAFSLDDFHQEKIDILHVRDAIEAVQLTGIEITIKTVITKKTRRLFNVLEGISDLMMDKSFSCNEITYIPYNNLKAVADKDLILKKGIPDNVCRGLHFTILPNGITFPCCNIGWSDALILGNAKETSLHEIYKNLHRSSLITILQEKGPCYFVSKLREQHIEIPENSFVNECHLCHTIFSNQKAKGIIREQIHQWENDKMNFIYSLVS